MSASAASAPRTSRGAATRARIVSVAAELMRANGVANTSLDTVLAASDTSKSQLYHYFADKDALVLAVIQRQTECVLATESASPSVLTSIAALRRWRNAVVELAREHDGAGGCPLGSLVSELAESPRSRALLSEGFARWESQFEQSFEAIRARSKHKSRANLKDLAMMLLTALQGGLLLAQVTRSTRPLELALDAAIEHIASQLK
jgi:TetR/AcrR family transcriptional repressor of nem operon